MSRALPLLALLTLAACGGTRTVPDEALAAVPADQVPELASLESARRSTELDLDRARVQLDQLRDQEKEARQALDEADTSLDKTREAKSTAVRLGDASAATNLDADIEASQSRLGNRTELVDELTTKIRQTELEITHREAELAYRTAELELARAKGASSGGADVDVAEFTQQRDAALTEYETARSKHLETLDP